MRRIESMGMVAIVATVQPHSRVTSPTSAARPVDFIANRGRWCSSGGKKTTSCTVTITAAASVTANVQ